MKNIMKKTIMLVFTSLLLLHTTNRDLFHIRGTLFLDKLIENTKENTCTTYGLGDDDGPHDTNY